MGDPQVTLDVLMKMLDDLGYPMTLENLLRNTWACRYGPGPLSAGSAASMGCLTPPGPRATSCNMRKERLEYVAAMVGPCWRMRMEFLWLLLWFSMLFSKFGRPKSAENPLFLNEAAASSMPCF